MSWNYFFIFSDNQGDVKPVIKPSPVKTAAKPVITKAAAKPTTKAAKAAAAKTAAAAKAAAAKTTAAGKAAPVIKEDKKEEDATEDVDGWDFSSLCACSTWYIWISVNQWH